MKPWIWRCDSAIRRPSSNRSTAGTGRRSSPDTGRRSPGERAADVAGGHGRRRRRGGVPGAPRALHCFLELCDRRGVDAELDAMEQLAERHPAAVLHVARRVSARDAGAARRHGRRRRAPGAGAPSAGVARASTSSTCRARAALAIRWAQGRLDEVATEIERARRAVPAIPRWRDALARGRARRRTERRGPSSSAMRDGFSTCLATACGSSICRALAEACVLVGTCEGATHSSSCSRRSPTERRSRSRRCRSARSRCARDARDAARAVGGGRRAVRAALGTVRDGRRPSAARVLVEHARMLVARGAGDR